MFNYIKDKIRLEKILFNLYCTDHRNMGIVDKGLNFFDYVLFRVARF